MSNYLDVENLNNAKNKLELYLKEEESNLTNLTSIFTSINMNLHTESSKELEKMQNELVNKMKLLVRMHINDVVVLQQNINKYRMAASMIVKDDKE